MADLFNIGIMVHHEFDVRLDPEYFGPDEIFFAPMLRAILKEYEHEAVRLKIIPSSTKGYLDAYHREKLDGMLIHMVSLEDLPVLRTLRDVSVCYVAIGVSGSRPSDRMLPCVDSDNREGGHAAAEHLLALGHQSFGCVNLANYYINHSDRMQGFMERVAAAGYPIDEDCLLTNPGYEHILFNTYASGWIRRLALDRKIPTGIFACDFNMAEATMAALKKSGIAIPDDVSVVGFDDPVWAARQTPPLTTLRQPVWEMGVRSARRLLAALKTPDPIAHVGGTEILPSELVIRESTGRVMAPAIAQG